MGTLTLHTSFSQEMTLISNRFLDEYMPRANGEFVKVYLLMLRICAKKGESLTLSALADRLNCTENDIFRAIRYWEKEGLLLLETDGNGEITGILMTTLTDDGDDADSKADDAVVIEAGSLPVYPSPEPVKGRVTEERTAELIEKEEIQELTFIAEQYLGKTLTSTEIQKLLYFYDELHFTTDLISYLIEYCAGLGKGTMRYIENVAYRWYNDGIKTVHDARSSVNNYNRDYFEVLKAFGISGRNPAPEEIAFMKRWLSTWQFPIDVVREACGRAVISTGKPSFKYADGILRNWNAANLKTLEEIASGDAPPAAPSRADHKPASKKKKTGFDYSDQRTYDYSELEKKLLKR